MTIHSGPYCPSSIRILLPYLVLLCVTKQLVLCLRKSNLPLDRPTHEVQRIVFAAVWIKMNLVLQKYFLSIMDVWLLQKVLRNDSGQSHHCLSQNSKVQALRFLLEIKYNLGFKKKWSAIAARGRYQTIRAYCYLILRLLAVFRGFQWENGTRSR